MTNDGKGYSIGTAYGGRRSARYLLALTLAAASGACAIPASQGPAQPVPPDRPATSINLPATTRMEPIPVARLAIMPVSEGTPSGLAEVLAASVTESLALLAPGVDLVRPEVTAELLAASRVETARESAFTYETRSARADHLAVDQITAAVGTPWILDLRVDRVETMEPRRGREDPERTNVPDAFGARVTLWSAGDSEPAWGGMVLIPEALAMADEQRPATSLLREMIGRFIAHAPIVSSG